MGGGSGSGGAPAAAADRWEHGCLKTDCTGMHRQKQPAHLVLVGCRLQDFLGGVPLVHRHLCREWEQGRAEAR